MTIALLSGLVVTSGGWGYAHYNNEILTENIENKNKVIDKKTTEIAKLEDVIVIKDDKLDAEKLVIEKQKDQLKNKNNDLKKKNNDLKKTINENKRLKEEIKKAKEKAKVEVKQQGNFSRKVDRSDVSGNSIGNFEMTSYVAMCREGCTGITATGIDIRGTTTYQGHRIIATDTSIIPLWSIVKIHTKSGSFTAISLDTGGAINGNIIDYLVSSEGEAFNNGRQTVSIEMIRRGK